MMEISMPMEANLLTGAKNNKPSFRNRFGRKHKFANVTNQPNKPTTPTGEALLANKWNYGYAYDYDKKWQIETKGSVHNINRLCTLVQLITSEETFRLIPHKDSNKIWKQVFIFKMMGGKDLVPNYQQICQALNLSNFWELSFYFIGTTGKVSDNDKIKLKKLIFYCTGETIIHTNEILGIMVKPGKTPQVSLWIKDYTSAQTIQKFMMDNIGFSNKLSNGFDGTRIQQH